MKYQYLDRQPAATLLPEGEYHFRVKGGEFQLSKAGNEMLVVELHNEEHNATVWDNLVFTEKALWKVDAFLRCVQAQPDKGEEFEFDNEFVESLIGKTGLVKIRIDEYEGKKKNKVDSYVAVRLDGKVKPSAPAKPVKRIKNPDLEPF